MDKIWLAVRFLDNVLLNRAMAIRVPLVCGCFGMLQWQSWVVATDPVWHTNLKVFNIGPFTEKSELLQMNMQELCCCQTTQQCL